MVIAGVKLVIKMHPSSFLDILDTKLTWLLIWSCSDAAVGPADPQRDTTILMEAKQPIPLETRDYLGKDMDVRLHFQNFTLCRGHLQGSPQFLMFEQIIKNVTIKATFP